MKHRFRKYLGNRGSALFMVLSTMTALMVLVMAMYFSVVSSRAVQFKVFNQEQAHRTAVSISDTIIASISQTGGTLTQNGTGGTTSLLATITSMGIGPDKAITTSANNFLAFDELNGTKFDDDQIGSYTVTITRFADETVGTDTAQVYDFAITTAVDGVYETAHSYVTIVLANEEMPNNRIKNIFTSTGYVPNDVYLDGGYYYNDVFYDNEYVMIGAHGSGTQKLYGDVTCAGTLELSQCDNITRDKTVTWAIGNDFIFKAQETNLNYGSQMSRVIVGGDCTIKYNALKGVNFYINGDLYIEGGNVDASVYYVNGNVYYNTNNINNCKNKIYCNGTIYDNGTVVSWSGSQKWDFADGGDAPNVSYNDIMNELKSLIGEQTYYNWDINDSDSGEDDYIPELNKEDGAYDPIVIAFNGSGNKVLFDKDKNEKAAGSAQETTDIVADPYTITYELPWQGKVCTDYFGSGNHLNYSAAVIEDVISASGNSADYAYTILIDTGDDPDNQYFLKVLPNEDNDGDGKNETFCFKGTTDKRLSVIVKGKGSVVIDVDAGVTYRDWYNSITMHETWFVLLGGDINYHNVGGKTVVEYDPMSQNALGIKPTSSSNQILSKYVHNCTEDCSVCNYSVTENAEDCPKDGCDGKLTEIYCAEHDYTYSFCPECDAGSEPLYKDGASKEYYGLCDCRVDRDAVDNTVAKLGTGSDEYIRLHESGSLVYPTVNIFLVSTEESANFIFSSADLGISENCFVGFIYAPYMTYKGIGGGGAGGFMKFGGGMIVSDYIIKQDMGYCSIYPEKLPTELMSANSAAEQLKGLVEKSWKIKLDTH